MNYKGFRNAVLEELGQQKEWSVNTDWDEAPEGGGPTEDFIELEQEKGAFYEFLTISLNQLYVIYMEAGWDAVTRDLDKYTRRQQHGVRRTRAVDYEEKLNGEGVVLYRKLKELRSEEASKKQLPPYFIFMNRSLYEMCCRQPATMEELKALYGVGEKNSGEYGGLFLACIRDFNGGRKKILVKMPEAEPENPEEN